MMNKYNRILLRRTIYIIGLSLLLNLSAILFLIQTINQKDDVITAYQDSLNQLRNPRLIDDYYILKESPDYLLLCRRDGTIDSLRWVDIDTTNDEDTLIIYHLIKVDTIDGYYYYILMNKDSVILQRFNMEDTLDDK